MAKMTPSGTKKHCKSTKPESHLASGQNVLSFFFFSSSDRLVQVHDSFMAVFALTAALIFTLSLSKCLNCDTIFVICTHAHKALLNDLFRARLLNYKYSKCDRECQSGSYLNRCLGQWHLLRKPVKLDFFLLFYDRLQTSAQACTFS